MHITLCYINIYNDIVYIVLRYKTFKIAYNDGTKVAETRLQK